MRRSGSYRGIGDLSKQEGKNATRFLTFQKLRIYGGKGNEQRCLAFDADVAVKGLLHNRGSTSQKNAGEYVGWEAYRIVVARQFEGL